MPLPDEQLESTKNDEIKVKDVKPGINAKVLIFGLPIFIVQLVAVYFITANILMKKFESKAAENSKGNMAQTADSSQNKLPPIDYGKYIYSLDDIIVNPADTDGKRLLLTSVGIDLRTANMLNDLKSRDAVVKDAIISVLSSKTVDQLDNTMYRDTLKTQIAGKISQMIPSVSINTIYFSKYILQ